MRSFIIIIALLVVSIPAIAATPYVILNDAQPDTATTSTPNFKDGWCDPSNDSFYNGWAFQAEYTEDWPSFNASYFNRIDLGYFGQTPPVYVQQMEIAIMNRSGSDGEIDLVILPDNGSGYPDLANYYDVQEDVNAASWNHGTYPDAEWNNYDYGIPGVATTGNDIWIGIHTYWPNIFDWYIAFAASPGDGGQALYDAGMFYVQDGFLTFDDMGYITSGAFCLRCYVEEIPGAVESASIGEIKAALK